MSIPAANTTGSYLHTNIMYSEECSDGVFGESCVT